jgi:hypothetical protein
MVTCKMSKALSTSMLYIFLNMRGKVGTGRLIFKFDPPPLSRGRYQRLRIHHPYAYVRWLVSRDLVMTSLVVSINLGERAGASLGVKKRSAKHGIARRSGR